MNRGFSLLELSLVLTIIGLLVGGVMVGKTLITGSETRRISADLERYAGAINAFRGKYMAFPGDMTNATKFWTATDAAIATCRTTASTGTSTCDGDGDGQMANSGNLYEALYAWKHLQNAGMVEGNFTGVTNNPARAQEHEAGTNCPRGPIANSCYGVGSEGVVASGHSYLWPGIYNNVLKFGIPGNADPLNVALSAERTFSIDEKLDDGKPGVGRVVTQDGTNMANCNAETNSTNAASATYNITGTTEQACAFYYRQI